MKQSSFVSAIVMLGLVVAGPGWADWDPGDGHKMHFPQLPDLNTTGLDVLASNADVAGGNPINHWVADDFRCRQTGLITDIHFWGSWLDDGFDHDNPNGFVGYHLAIYNDVPVGMSGTNFSMPGLLLWDMVFGPESEPFGPTYSARLVATADEGFYDPRVNQVTGADTQVWQYNFLIDPEEAFGQEQGEIYWLAVQAIIDTPLPSPLWGWKTSRDHWNDDAVWGPTAFNFPDTWSELRYPTGHSFAGESIDLAFVITPEPGTLALMVLVGLLTVRRR